MSRTNELLDELRQLVTSAKSVPMSASCVVNRAEILDLVDRVRAGLPDELDQAQSVLATSDDHRAQGQAEADRIIAEAHTEAARLASDTEVARVAREEAERVRNQAAEEAEALRRETDVFIDSRMASFESVLHKTVSQVATARSRLSERSGLDADQAEALPPRV